MIKSILILFIYFAVIDFANSQTTTLACRDDFRLTITSSEVISKISHDSEILLDSSMLIYNENAREHWKERTTFLGEFRFKIGDKMNVADLLNKFRFEYGKNMGGFLNNNTVIKIFRKNSITKMRYGEPIVDDFILKPGDIILLQNLGEIF